MSDDLRFGGSFVGRTVAKVESGIDWVLVFFTDGSTLSGRVFEGELVWDLRELAEKQQP